MSGNGKMRADQVLGGLRGTEAVQRSVSSMGQIRWSLGVVLDHGMERAVVQIVPDPDQFEALRSRLAKAGVKRVRKDQWARADFDPVNVLMFVRDGHVNEISAEYRENVQGGFRNRRSRIAANPPQPVSPRWMDAALARRPVIALIPFEAFGIEDDAWEGTVVTDELLDGAAERAAGARMLWAGLGTADLGLDA
ncbi:hypothetical protein [Streptomyces sp. NPDC049879]|uniref:hypothetical protein n=1 Tax=Streptomyces sp. NPDC049879 TaxID=3365598 RepID=UPI0037B221EC